MASDRKILANRQNATRSTGPRSASGKVRSRLNALRHGLSGKINNAKVESDVVRQLIRHIAQDFGIDVDADVAFSLAEAELDIVRVRNARVTLLENIIVEKKFDREKIRKMLDQIYAIRISLAPFETSDSLAGRLLSHSAENSLEELLATPITKKPVDPEIAFTVVISRLANYDRYESRAISRRRRSIRELNYLQKSASKKLLSSKS